MNNHDTDAALTLSDALAVFSRRRRTIALVAFGVFSALAAYAYRATPIYRASSLVSIDRIVDVLVQTGYQPDEDYLATQAKLIVSDSALSRAYEELKLERTPDFAGGVPVLRLAVSVLAVPRTRLCTVNAESTDPALASRIANALAQNFVAQNLNHQLAMPRHVLAALQTRAAGPEAEKVYESLPAVINNSLIQQIKADILRAELALADLRGRYKDAHPAVAAMESQLGLLHAARKRELGHIVSSVKTQLAGQLRPNNVRVIDAARVPSRPVRPRKSLALLLGSLGGLALGLLAALGLESLDETVRSHTDLERKLGLPFLGEIPHSTRKKGDRVYAPLVAKRESLPGEAFRDLRTMLAIAGRRVPDPFLLVTSTMQQEGKSFVATNLAVSLSQLGRKVLIIDGDLRRPAQHLNLGTQARKGLADLLSGRVDDPAELVQKTELPQLDVVAAGGRPANASELLDTEQLARLVEWSRQRYDRVVVDCPPVFPVGDVLLWGRHARSSILVARCGRTPAPLVQMACQRLRAGGLDLLGGVLNGSRSGALSRVYELHLDASSGT